MNVPVHVLRHPTDLQVPRFSFDRFEQRVVQVGAWLRDPYAIYRLRLPTLQKCLLKCHNSTGYSSEGAARGGGWGWL